jgi:hypothetical protein
MPPDFEFRWADYAASQSCEDYMKRLQLVGRNFYWLGLKDQSKNVRPILETLQVNVDNKKLSDAEFREFTKGIVEQLFGSLARE